jgi:peptidoglycan/LPS O-acetylase OafA/YrhL
VDPPAWSLRYEIWAIPALPAAIVLARRFWWLCLGLAAAALLAVFVVDFRFMFAAAMIAGVAASVQDWRFDVRVGNLALWLGKISYSLYLTHWIVLAAAGQVAGPWAEVAALPVVLLVAWAAWWAIERPSIAASRTLDKSLLVLFFKKEQRFL